MKKILLRQQVVPDPKLKEAIDVVKNSISTEMGLSLELSEAMETLVKYAQRSISKADIEKAAEKIQIRTHEVLDDEDADYINSIMSELLRGGRNGRLPDM